MLAESYSSSKERQSSIVSGDRGQTDHECVEIPTSEG